MEDQVVNERIGSSSFPDYLPDWAELREDLGETTPRERMKYAIELTAARGIHTRPQKINSRYRPRSVTGKGFTARFSRHTKS